MKKIIVIVLCVIIAVATTTVTTFAATAATTDTATTDLVPAVEKMDAIISEKEIGHPISGDYNYYELYCPMCVYVSEDFYASVNVGDTIPVYSFDGVYWHVCETPKSETYVQNVLQDSDHSYKYYVELSDGRIIRVPKSKQPVVGQDVVVKNNGKIKGYSNFLWDVLLSVLYLFFIVVLILVGLGMGVGFIGLVLFMISPEADRI